MSYYKKNLLKHQMQIFKYKSLLRNIRLNKKHLFPVVSRESMRLTIMSFLQIWSPRVIVLMLSNLFANYYGFKLVQELCYVYNVVSAIHQPKFILIILLYLFNYISYKNYYMALVVFWFVSKAKSNLKLSYFLMKLRYYKTD